MTMSVASIAWWLNARGEMARQVAGFDWRATPLGAIDHWPAELRIAAALVLEHPLAAALVWGAGRVTLCNDAFRPMLGKADTLGRSFAAMRWGEIASAVDAAFAGESRTMTSRGPGGRRASAGGEARFAVSCAPVRTAEGVVGGAIVTATAIGATARTRGAPALLKQALGAGRHVLQGLRGARDGTAAREQGRRVRPQNARARLRESEARSQELIAGIAQATWEFDPIGKVVTDSPSWREFTGQSLEDWLGGRSNEMVHPDDRAAAEHAWREAVATGRKGGIDFRLFHAQSGEWRWSRVRAAPLLRDDGSVEKWIGMNIDIHDRRCAEDALRRTQADQAFLLELSDALRRLTDAVEIQREASRLLGRHIGAPRVAYGEFDGDAVVIRCDYADGVPSMVGRHPRGAFGRPVSDVGGRTGIVVVHDTQAAPELSPEEKARFRSVGIAAFAVAVLPKGNEPAVVFGAHSDVPRAWTTSEIGLIEQTAERTWAAVERARAEAARRAGAERLRQFGEASRDIVWIRDAATLQWVYLTPAFERIHGVSRHEVRTGDGYRNWQRLVVAEDREEAAAALARVCAGEHATFEYRIRRPGDGAIRWLRDTGFPLVDEAGAVTLIGGISNDFTEVRETELRFRTLVEGIPQLVWRATELGEWTWANPQWSACTGQDEAQYRGWGWLDAIHPDDRTAARQAWSDADEHGGFEVEYRVRRARDDTYRWFQTRAAPVRDRAGTIIEWLGTSTDIQDMRAAQDMQRMLLTQLQYRVRNILAITRSIISRSDDGERSTEDYVQHVLGRISALARTQVLLTRRAGASVDLQNLLRDELLAQTAADDRFALGGPDVALSARAAEVLTLAVHELATNATKYGVFSRDSGRLDIRWSVDTRDGTEWVTLDWIESGVPIIDLAPRRHGFGAELVSRRVPYELKGAGRFELAPGGLRSRIEFPLVDGDSILQTDDLSGV